MSIYIFLSLKHLNRFTRPEFFPKFEQIKRSEQSSSVNALCRCPPSKEGVTSAPTLSFDIKQNRPGGPPEDPPERLATAPLLGTDLPLWNRHLTARDPRCGAGSGFIRLPPVVPREGRPRQQEKIPGADRERIFPCWRRLTSSESGEDKRRSRACASKRKRSDWRDDWAGLPMGVRRSKWRGFGGFLRTKFTLCWWLQLEQLKSTDRTRIRLREIGKCARLCSRFGWSV